MILGIESSCDDTSVALLEPNGFVRALSSLSQDTRHAPFGGIVPEVASRQHTEALLPLVDSVFQKCGASWREVTGIAVTSRPGLIGSLLVGVVTAKTLSLALDLPLIGVNHIEGHLLAPFLRDDQYQPNEGFDFPYLALAVSGGHTHLFRVEDVGSYFLIGHTVDDAAGEAFDKFAKRVGLGFPGGHKVDEWARSGNPRAYEFPRARLEGKPLNFSFSGLKSSMMRILEDWSDDRVEASRADLCASYQEAIVDVLVDRMQLASQMTGLKNWAVTGGVSANSRLRERVLERAQSQGTRLALPPLRYCTDNAAMIALAGAWRLKRGESADQSLSASSGHLQGDWIQA